MMLWIPRSNELWAKTDPFLPQSAFCQGIFIAVTEMDWDRVGLMPEGIQSLSSSAVGTQDLGPLLHELEREACYGTDEADYGTVLVTFFMPFPLIWLYDGTCFLTACVMFGRLLQFFKPNLLLEEQRGWIMSCQISLVIGFCTLVLWCLLVIYFRCISWFFSLSLATENSGVMGLNLVGNTGIGT